MRFISSYIFFSSLEFGEVNGERDLLIIVEFSMLFVIFCKKEGDKKDV